MKPSKKWWLVLICAALASALALPPTADADHDGEERVLYGMAHLSRTGPNLLYSIDPGTGEAALVGSTGTSVLRISAMALSDDGVMYAVGVRNDAAEAHVLVTIDLETAEPTEIGPTGLEDFVGVFPQRRVMSDLSFSKHGELYAYAFPGGGLATIDLATGRRRRGSSRASPAPASSTAAAWRSRASGSCSTAATAATSRGRARQLAGEGVFLRQVVDGTHPRIHEQLWALYAGGRRTDLWFFSPTPDRTDSKLVAPLQVETVRLLDDSGLELRVSGAMIRPQGAGWLQGVDLIFAAEGSELGYRHAERRYSFTYGYDRGGGRNPLVSVETPRQRDGRTVIEQRLASDVPRDLEERCGVRPLDDFPSGSFEEMVEIATCILTASPKAETRWREVDEPTFIERGGQPVVEARSPKGLPEASLDPPSDAIELCAGHVTGAPLPDGRPGPHISWTLYTSTETRSALAERYYDALGDEGHTADSGCDTWKRPADRPERIVEVCELAAEGPWSDCPPPPEKARSRILISTMARAD